MKIKRIPQDDAICVCGHSEKYHNWESCSKGKCGETWADWVRELCRCKGFKQRPSAPESCKDPRHGTPCPLPCEACEADGCEPSGHEKVRP